MLKKTTVNCQDDRQPQLKERIPFSCEHTFHVYRDKVFELEDDWKKFLDKWDSLI